MSAVVGVDPSLTGAGVAMLRHGRAPQARVVRTEGHRGDSTAAWARRIARQSAAVLALVPPDTELLVIEGPSHGSSHGNPHERAGLWWGITCGAQHRGISVAVLAPQTRAKWATGNGRAAKAEVLAAMRQLWPSVPLVDDNAADATALATAGAQWLGWPVPAWAGQHDALAAGRWPELKETTNP